MAPPHIRIAKPGDESGIHEGLVWVVEQDRTIQGHGLGRKLMDLMLLAARDSGARTVTLDSTITSHDFYKHFGFSDCGPMKIQDIGGSAVRGFPMVLQLA